MNKKTIILIILIAVLILAGYFFLWPYYQSWRIGHDYQKFEKGFLDYLKKDTYGGKTPQETYEMFVTVLKNGDIDLAAKYFYWEKQETKKERLQKMKDESKLEEYVNGLPKWEEIKEEEYWDKDGRRYSWQRVSTKTITYDLPRGDGTFISQTIEPGEYTREMILQINKQANIWKIYNL